MIIFQCHTGSGSHLKIKPTCYTIIKDGYKWKSMESDEREFIYRCQICQMCTDKLRKGTIVHHSNSSKRLERFQIDLVTLASMIASKKHKYLFTMVDHFSKFGWVRCISDKTSHTVIKTLKSCLATHHKPQMIKSDNGPEFTSREFKNFLIEQNIEQKFGPPYRHQ